MKEERTVTSKSATTVPISSPVIEEDTVSRFITKERSLSPFCIPKIQEHRREENSTTISHFLLSSNLIPKKQTIVNESILSPSDSPQGILQEDDENVHGSSEFMLVLYPENGTREESTIDMENSIKNQVRSSTSKYK